MREAEAIWRRKSDDEVLAASACLDEYTEDGRRIILAEAKRRSLHVAPIARAAAEIAASTSDSRRCAYCETRILFGGRRQGQLRFCNEACRQAGIQLLASHQIPVHIVTKRLSSLFNGSCPKCDGPGPVDVHTSYRVISVLVFTSWSNRPAIVCRSCGNRTKVRDAVISFGLGWWGVPWGVIMTPIQIARNVTGLIRRTDTDRPSAQLEKLVRLDLLDEAVAAPADAATDR